MTVPTPSDSAPPLGLSTEDYAAVRAARGLADGRVQIPEDSDEYEVLMDRLSDMLTAYDRLAARAAWLATQVTMPGVPTISPQDRVDLEGAIARGHLEAHGGYNSKARLAADFVIEAGFHR